VANRMELTAMAKHGVSVAEHGSYTANHGFSKGGASIFGGETERVSRNGGAKVLSEGSRIFRGEPLSPLGGAMLFGGEPDRVPSCDLDDIDARSSRSGSTICGGEPRRDSESDSGGRDFDVFDARRSVSSIGGEGSSGVRFRLPSSMLRLLNCINIVHRYKYSGGLLSLRIKPRVNSRRHPRLQCRLGRGDCLAAAAVSGCTSFSSDCQGNDLLSLADPISGEEVGYNGFDCVSDCGGNDVGVNCGGDEGGDSSNGKADGIGGGVDGNAEWEPDATALSTTAIAAVVVEVKVMVVVVAATQWTMRTIQSAAASCTAVTVFLRRVAEPESIVILAGAK
jgi:hypothetical protein